MYNNTWEYFKNYKWNSIMINYFKIIISALLIPFLFVNILVVTYNTYVNINKSIANHTNMLYQYQVQSDKNIFELYSVYSHLINNSIIQSYMLIDNNTSLDGYETTLLFYKIKALLTNYMSLNSSISSIYLYNTNTNYLAGTNTSGYLENLPDTSWYDLYVSLGKKSYTASRTIDSVNSANKYITYCFDYNISSSTKGIIVINVNSANYDTYKVENTTCGFYNEQGIILHSSDSDLIGKNIFEIKGFTPPVNITELVTNHSKNTVTSFYPSGENNFTYFFKTDNLLTSEIKSNIIIILILSLLITIIISIIIAFLLSMKLYSSIANIMIMLDKPKEDNNATSKSEIMFIIDSIVNKSEQLDKINFELAEKMILLRKSQTIALQTQITPHFLYNTLQAINLVAIKTCKGNNDVSKMIILFSGLLHAALDTKNYLVPLKDEIAYTKKYLELQKIKFKDKFTVYWDIPEHLEEFKIVKLSLQPILENALHHGILPASKPCNIMINAYIEKNNLIITVGNNGILISDEKLKEINDVYLNINTIKETNNIGLNNINQRIKLIHGDEYGLKINIIDGYTTVTLTFPQHI